MVFRDKNIKQKILISAIILLGTAGLMCDVADFVEAPYGIEMVYVKGGTFTMGCTPEQENCGSDERPPHKVTLNDFYIGKYVVTQKQWGEIMGTDVSQHLYKANKGFSGYDSIGDNYPMSYVSWNDAMEFIKRLNEKTGKNYRLPTEAEWEYAARGGNKSRGYQYSGSNVVGEVAWYAGNSNDNGDRKSHPVGTKKANELGVHDMSGNVLEWVWDRYEKGYYENSPTQNPQGSAEGLSRVVRGGSFGDYAREARVSYRTYVSTTSERYGNLGFRLALSPEQRTNADGDATVSVQTITKSIIKDTPKAQGNTAATVSPIQTTQKITERNFPDAPYGIEMVYVESGTFIMGCTSEQENACGKEEQPAHQVTLTKDFYIGKYEVTQAQWQAVMGYNPSVFDGAALPVEKVNWYDAIEFCNKLSELAGLKPAYSIDKMREDSNNNNHYFDDKKWSITVIPDANGYRLPTDAEWEYAARGGKKSDGYKYSGSNTVDEVAWYEDYMYGMTQPVGKKKANELGIHDMSGNVGEWVFDWYMDYSGNSQVDPKGSVMGSERVYRNGGWDADAVYARVSFRGGEFPIYKDASLGFRLARNSK